MWNKIKYYKYEFIVFSLLKSLQTKILIPGMWTPTVIFKE